MKLGLSLVLIILSAALFTPPILAQDSPTAAEAAADLRTRLSEIQAREAALQVRLEQLEEALRPENIERSFAGIGSTRPEELREQRRRELTIERDGVRRQLDLLATSRGRLESAIQSADNRAYQQSAQGLALNQVGTVRMYSAVTRRLLIAAATAFGLLVIFGVIALIRRW